MGLEVKSTTGPDGKPVDSSGADKGTPVPATELKIGDKVVTAAEVTNLINQQALVTQGLQEVSLVKDALTRYGIDAPTFVTNAEGAFAVMSKLIDEGVIDNQGNVLVKPTVQPPVGGTGDSTLRTTPVLPGASSGAGDAVSRALEGIAAITEKISKIERVVTDIDTTQASLIRTNLEKELMGKFPILKGDDTSRIIAIATRDRSKNVFEHAKIFAERKTTELNELRTQHAKEFGVDLTKFDENKLREPGNQGAASFFKGKKFSFNPKKGEETVSPLKATKEFINSLR